MSAIVRAVVAALATATCGLDTLTGSGDAVKFALQGDSLVLVGASLQLAPQVQGGAALVGVHVQWQSSAPSVASVDSAGKVMGKQAGTTTITAIVTAPELQAAGESLSVRLRIRYAGIAMSPVDSLTGLGQSVIPTVNGTDAANAPAATVAAAFTSSDTTVLAIVGNAIVARKNGTATITASFDGYTDQRSVKVRRVAKRITFGASPFVFRFLARDTSVAVTVVDTRDSVMPSPAITWTSSNATIATVSAAGLMRALQVGSTSIRAAVDTAGSNLAVSVSQAPASLAKSAGDNQTLTAGAVVTTLPTVTVTDAGGAPITGSSVVFSVASGGGVITGATQTTDAAGKATVGSWTLGTTSGSNALLATVGSLSTTFGVSGTSGTATKLVIQQAPSGTNSVGAALAPVLQVTVRDANNNLVTTATTSITVALAANPAAATLGGATTVSAVAGVAAFGNLTISAPGSGYTLAASATGLAGATTAAFNVVGPASKLVFTVQPANVAAGASITPAVQVAVQDAAGNTISGATNAITLAIGANPGVGTLTAGGATAATSGVASFAAVSVDKAGTGYTLTASASGLTGATSATFNVTAGAASKLLFVVQPSNTSPATTISPAVQVAVTDALGNTVTSSTVTVTMAIGTNAGSGTLGGTASVAAVGGVASFSALQITNIGNGYTLAASATGLTGATSGAFNIVGAGTPRALKFVTQPASAVAGANIAPAITVKVVDSVGTTVNSSAAAISLTLGANPGTGTLAGTVTVGASGGVATFSAARVNRTGSGYTLVATASGLAPDTSTAFAISAGSASTLAFTAQPSNVPVGATLVPPVQVAVMDNQGNVVPSATNTITMAIGTNPGSASLGGSLAVAAANGLANFSNLSVPIAGSGYTLTATATGLTGATSAAFNVTTGSPKTLVFVVEPVATVAGAVIAPSITVKVVDSVGATVVSPVTAVTLAFNDNPNTGTLSGTLTANTVNGVATFSNVKVNRSGTGYTLLATATGLAPDTSAAFAISTGAAAALAFSVQPGSVGAGVTIAPPVQVSVTDNQGNVVTSSTASVALAMGANPGTATLTGGSAVSAANGVATFSGLSLNKVANSYTVVASSSGLISATSATFNITAGVPTVLDITSQPSTVNVGAAMSNVVVTVRDAAGNTATSATMPVTLALLNNPSGAVLGGTVTQSAVAGVATFTGLTVDKAGQGFTLKATAAGSGGPLTPDTSSTFNGIGTATALFFTTQPSGAVKNTAIAPAIVVEARDAAGNRATGFNGNVAMGIQANVNSGTLTGTTSKAASAGVATFNDLRLDSAGTGYTLRATASAVTGVTSSSFDIAGFGSATKLVFKTQPSTADANVAIQPGIEVEVQDASGNRVTNSSAAVTLAFGANPGAATLGGTNPISAVNGVAPFSNLTVNAVGTAYTLTANATGLSPVTSNTFNIVTPGSAVRLRFDVQPTSNTAGSQISPAIVVSAVNSSGSVVTGASGSIALAVDSGPVGGTITSANLSNGQVSYATVALTVAGTYRLRATGGGLAQATSAAFTITHGFANKLAFVTLPQPIVAGSVLPSVIQVQVQDVYGNRVMTAGNSIRISYNNVAAWPCLDGDTVHSAVIGQATFSALRPRCTGGPGGSMSLYANASGLAGASTAAFAVDPSPPAFLAYLSAPTSITGRRTFSVCVSVRDSIGNYANGGPLVSLSLGSNPAGGHTGGTTSAVSAFAYNYDPNSYGYPGYCTGYNAYVTQSYMSPTIDSLGTGYTLVATAPGLVSATTGNMNVVASTATQLGFVVPPANAQTGVAVSPAMRVCVLDAYGNEVRTAAGSVALSIGVNPGSAAIGGTLTRTLASGCANFNDITLSAQGTGYALLATPSSVNGVTSASYSPTFNVTP